MKRYPPGVLIQMRAELFNLKQSLGKMKQRVLYNPKSKRHEIYKSRDIERRMAMANGESLAADSDDEDNEDEEEEGDGAAKERDGEPKLKKSVINLNIEECEFLDNISIPSDLLKFDMNKALDSDDEYNMVKRKSRTKA